MPQASHWLSSLIVLHGTHPCISIAVKPSSVGTSLLGQRKSCSTPSCAKGARKLTSDGVWTMSVDALIGFGSCLGPSLIQVSYLKNLEHKVEDVEDVLLKLLFSFVLRRLVSELIHEMLVFALWPFSTMLRCFNRSTNRFSTVLYGLTLVYIGSLGCLLFAGFVKFRKFSAAFLGLRVVILSFPWSAMCSIVFHDFLGPQCS